jgi:hypothetical protein
MIYNNFIDHNILETVLIATTSGGTVAMIFGIVVIYGVTVEVILRLSVKIILGLE